MAPYRALLDACVLVPVSLADTMLRVAEKGLYRPLWSDRILTEALDAIAEIRPGADAAKRFTVMRQAFSEALVTGWEGREVGIILPDPDDRHVVAAAIHGGAHAIVTANVVDFPSAMLRPLGLEAVHPDDFLLDQLDLSPAAIVQVFSEQAADTRRPPLSRQDLATILGRAGVPRFAAEVLRLMSGPPGEPYLAAPAVGAIVGQLRDRRAGTGKTDRANRGICLYNRLSFRDRGSSAANRTHFKTRRFFGVWQAANCYAA